MPARRIPIFAALLAAALAPPALAADPPARAIARSPAVAPATTPPRGRSEVSPGTADPGKSRQRAQPAAANGAGEANVTANSRPGGARQDIIHPPRATPVRGSSPQGSGRQAAAGSTRSDPGAAVGQVQRPATRRERTAATGTSGQVLRDTSGARGEPAVARTGATGSNGHVLRDTSGRGEPTAGARAGLRDTSGRGEPTARAGVNGPRGAADADGAVARTGGSSGARGRAERGGVAGHIDTDVTAAVEQLAVAVAAAADDSEDMAPKTSARGRARADRPAARAAVTESPGATSCSAALQAAPTLQYEAARASLREFWWSDMARFFETSLDELEPQPTQVTGADTIASDEAIRRSGLNRKLLEQLARSRSVDLLSERELAKIGKALAGASPGSIAWLLRADSPSLRAYVWNWLATTPTGTCTLFKLDRASVEAAIRDRSVAVEHGEDLIFRPLGDYALAARARVAAADPQNFDGLLRTLAQEDIDPRVRAIVAGLRVRRGHAGSIEQGLVDPQASVRGAVAAAALHRDRALYEQRVLEHGAHDPIDLVTELVVGELLNGPDGATSVALTNSRDPRIRAALSRWRGRGDPMAPLPAPDKPLKFAAPKRERQEARSEPARSEVRGAPARNEVRGVPVREEAVEAVEAIETDDAPREEHPAAAEPARPGRRAQTTGGPRLPGIFDDPAGDAPLP